MLQSKVFNALGALCLILISSCSFSGSKPCFEPKCASLTEMGCILAGEEVFMNNCSDEGIAYSWDFGDGNTSTLRSPRHIYEEAGNYTVTLTVETEKKSNSSTLELLVEPSLYGTWVGEADYDGNSIPISFAITQEASKIKGSSVFGGNTGGVINSKSHISGDSIEIQTSFVSVFYFDGEEMSMNSVFSYVGIINPGKTRIEGDEFSVRGQVRGSWWAEKQE